MGVVNLVVQSPPADRGMVVQLINHFEHHLAGVAVKCRSVAHLVDERHLIPNQESHRVGYLVDVFALRIVCHADGRCSHFVHDVHVFLIVLVCQCPSLVVQVLMPAHAIHGIGHAVERKALVLGEGHFAETELYLLFVNTFGRRHLDMCGVKIRMQLAHPQLRIVDV